MNDSPEINEKYVTKVKSYEDNYSTILHNDKKWISQILLYKVEEYDLSFFDHSWRKRIIKSFVFQRIIIF